MLTAMMSLSIERQIETACDITTVVKGHCHLRQNSGRHTKHREALTGNSEKPNINTLQEKHTEKDQKKIENELG